MIHERWNHKKVTKNCEIPYLMMRLMVGTVLYRPILGNYPRNIGLVPVPYITVNNWLQHLLNFLISSLVIVLLY